MRGLAHGGQLVLEGVHRAIVERDQVPRHPKLLGPQRPLPATSHRFTDTDGGSEWNSSVGLFVTLALDTHKDVHVAVALDQLGRWLGVLEIPTTVAGYGQLLAWASAFGTIDRIGIEGTGSHGAGLARWLTARGLIVIEVDRPGPTALCPTPRR
jgi:hypothetical protein